MAESLHCTLVFSSAQLLKWSGACLCSKGLDGLDADFGWDGVLATVRQVVHSLVHTTMQATPTQIVFGLNTLLNIPF